MENSMAAREIQASLANGCNAGPLDLAFASGMTNKSDMRGALDAKVPFGVMAGSLTTLQLSAALPTVHDLPSKAAPPKEET